MFTTLSRVPAPTGPTQTVRWPSASKRGVTRERASSGPDAKIVSWPCSAGSLLPDTGASSSVMSGRSLLDQGRDALDPGNADRAHLHPDRARRERGEHALVAGDRHDGVGIGHHRDDDRGSPRCVGSGVGDLRAELGEVSGRLRLRFQTIVGIPARSALVAIPWPIVPMPSTATGSCVRAIVLLHVSNEQSRPLAIVQGSQ